MSKWDGLFLQELEKAEGRFARRRLRAMESDAGGESDTARGRIRLAGRSLLNFSSNDYLGLARHPLLAERAAQWVHAYGSGARASRLVCGNLSVHESVEAKLARAKGTEAALLLGSGWQANAAVLPALLRAASAHSAGHDVSRDHGARNGLPINVQSDVRNDARNDAANDVREGEPRVYADKLNHASLHHGCQAAGIRQIRFRHNDLDHLESLLTAHADRPGPAFIVTESVFSMDGDRLDVVRLADIARRHHAFVYLDEAHATGVLGPRGMGLAGWVPGGIDLTMGTFSKAMGSYGAYVAGSRAMCDYLINTCSGFIYTTALPPQVLGAIDAALDLVPTLNQERAHLARCADRLRAGLQGLGFDTAGSSTQIVPAMIGEERRALEISAALEKTGFLVVAIRPPTVPPGTSRLRIALSAAHDEADVDALLDALGGL
jgi:8-amino-7-oxononanoate synthase